MNVNAFDETALLENVNAVCTVSARLPHENVREARHSCKLYRCLPKLNLSNVQTRFFCVRILKMKTRTVPKGETLYRAGYGKNANYIWVSNEKGFREYQKRAFQNDLGIEYRKKFTFTAPRNLKLLDITNANTLRSIKNKIRSEYIPEVNLGFKISKSGVSRVSYSKANRVVANAIKQLRNRNKLNYNGWIYNNPNLEKNILIFSNVYKPTNFKPDLITEIRYRPKNVLKPNSPPRNRPSSPKPTPPPPPRSSPKPKPKPKPKLNTSKLSFNFNNN